MLSKGTNPTGLAMEAGPEYQNYTRHEAVREALEKFQLDPHSQTDLIAAWAYVWGLNYAYPYVPYGGPETERVATALMVNELAHPGQLAAYTRGDAAATKAILQVMAAALEPDAPAPIEWKEAAQSLLDKARAAEPKVTSDLKASADDVGGTLEGLENRLKTVDSLARKLQGKPGKDAPDPDSINDVLRYSITFPFDKATVGIGRIVDALKAKGYTLIDRNNSFLPNQQFVGIRTTWETPTGQQFELQIHTDEGYIINKSTHNLYEVMRTMPSEPEKSALKRRIKAMASRIKIPEGAYDILPNDERK